MSIVDHSSGSLMENWVTLSTESPDFCKSLTMNVFNQNVDTNSISPLY